MTTMTMTAACEKPRVSPYRRFDRIGKWVCHSHRGLFQGTGYSVEDAYYKWLAAVTCKPVDHLRREDAWRRNYHLRRQTLRL